MPQFFIHRPVFAWVIAAFIVLLGLIAIPQLPIERYPSVAPPTISISATYPGATAQTMNDSVISLIERELSSVRNLLYFEASTDTTGAASITVTFRPGTNIDMAQVDVQNRLKSVEARLPQAVRQNGVSVESAGAGFMMLVNLVSPDGRFDELALADYMARNFVGELRRIDGVGRIQQWGAERAMRIWVDPAKLVSYGLTMEDFSTAIAQQNMQVSPGRVGDTPTVPGQRVTTPLTVRGQLETVEQFAEVPLRAGRNGSRLVLGDVARVELGAQSYTWTSWENGKPAAGLAVQLAPGANAVKTADAVLERVAELSSALPSGMEYTVPFNTAPFVKVSIEKVVYTLVEAMVLVFLVMYLFLQNARYTLIPAIVGPIAIMGTLAVMFVAGFSVNVLTMFGMVLAIGIIVDDAIVVVENVERLMATEGLSPKDATIKAMHEITGAIVGITLVLTAVFIPMAFASGSVGVIYQQFALSMAVAILLSAFLALSLTPALCATLLKPVPSGHHARKGLFGWFNKGVDSMTRRYESQVYRLVRRGGAVMLVYLVIGVALVLVFRQLPSSFLPEEDQGYFMTSFQLPANATAERTQAVVDLYQKHVETRPSIESNQTFVGWGFSGSGPNAAFTYTVLKDWASRKGATAQEEVELAKAAMSSPVEGTVTVLMPPAINSLGTSSGFSLRLQDRLNQGHTALKAAEAKLLELARQSSLLSDVSSDGLPAGASVQLDIDRQKAQTLGVSFSQISDTLSIALGSHYVNDFPNAGRMQQVILQADAVGRMQIEDVLSLGVRNQAGGIVALRELIRPVWTDTPLQLNRYLGYPSLSISGSPAPGVSSGAAMAEIERIAGQLPGGFAIEWAGQSLQERQSASQAPLLLALSMLVVFLVLAALYESWSIPISVMLVVPLGLIGCVTAVLLRDMPNDVFFKVGLITIIGLSAKNAVLIVEFAKQLHEQGVSLVDAAATAARLRLRPILMTSLAFAMGVMPLMFAVGASAETQHAIGTGVFGGIISATVLAVFFVPVFFVVVMGIQQRLQKPR